MQQCISPSTGIFKLLALAAHCIILGGSVALQGQAAAGKMTDDLEVASELHACTPRIIGCGAAFPKRYVMSRVAWHMVWKMWYDVTDDAGGMHDPEATSGLSTILPCSVLASSGLQPTRKGVAIS